MGEGTLVAPHVVLRESGTGVQPYVDGKGIKVKYVADDHERFGLTVDQIADNFDLTLAEVHAALAYYFDHRDEIDARLRDDEAVEEELRRQSMPAVTRPAGA